MPDQTTTTVKPRRAALLAAVVVLAVAAGCAKGADQQLDTAADANERPAETTTAPSPVEVAQPETTVSTQPTTTQAPEDPEVTAARGTAQDYLDYSGFCRPSLIDQLEFEGYGTEAATTAVDSLGVDWANETVRVAQSYVDYTDFSHAGLVDQLTFEGCEPAHAEQAATQVLGF